MEKIVKKIATLLLCCLSVALAIGQAQEMPFSTDDGFEGRGYSPVYGSNIAENNPGNGLVFDVYNDVTDAAVSAPADAAGSYMVAFAAPIPLSASAVEGNQSITFTWIDSKDYFIISTNSADISSPDISKTTVLSDLYFYNKSLTNLEVSNNQGWRDIKDEKLINNKQ
jgi:hypothetical protein